MKHKLIRIVMVIMVADLCITLLMSLRVYFGRNVLVVPGAKSEEYVLPDNIATDQVVSFSILYLNSIDNFNPDTLEKNVEYLLSKVSPQFYPELKEMYKSLSKQVKQTKLSSHLVIFRDNVEFVVFDNKNGRYELLLPAERNFYSKGKQIGTQNVIYRLSLVRGAVTELNPYGLYITKQKIIEKSKEKKNE